MKTSIEVSTPVIESARVAQVNGIFDVPPMKRSTLKWNVDLPIEERPWNVGLIVGPSGSGKSTVAKRLFQQELDAYDRLKDSWDPQRSLLDSFPAAMPIKDIVEALSSVGFSSPPSWVRPFHVLSNGEQFRVMMARVLTESRQRGEIALCDEFTSVVDRTVAQIGSSAIEKTVRRRGQQFVAVTCHEDVEPWLRPDWVYRPSDNSFSWRELRRRPEIKLSIYRTHHSAWRFFKHHHYLTSDLNKAAYCFVAFAELPGFERRLVAFDSWLPFVGRLRGPLKMRRSHRVVCLPDYQGVGIANALQDFTAGMWKGLDLRATLGTSHPGFIAARMRSPNWRMTRAPDFTSRGAHGIDKKRATNRLMASFEWTGPGFPRAKAEEVLNTWEIV